MREYLGVLANRRSFSSLALSIAIAGSLVGCDSSARSKELPVSPEQQKGASLVYESCAASSDCSEQLRCIDATCQSTERSRLGDFYAAAGRLALAAGDTEEAAKAYNDAVTQYEQEKLSPPLDLLCEQGAAMAAGLDDKQLAEAAARILHKCVLALPGNSQLARHAYDALATLGPAGLDEEVIARSETGDLYMSGEAEQPDLSALKLSIVPQGKKNRKRGFELLVAALEGPASKKAFAACWQKSWKQNKTETLAVEIPFEYRFFLDEDDAARDRASLKVGSRVPPTDPNLISAGQCIETAASAAAEEVIKGLKDDTRWDTSVLIKIGS